MAYTYYLVFAALAAAAIAVFCAWSVRAKRPANLLLVICSAIAALLISLLAFPALSSSYNLALFMGVGALASMLAVLYARQRLSFVFIAILISFAAIVSWQHVYAVVGMFGIGTVLGMLYKERVLARKLEDKSMRRTSVEIERDMVQIFVGIVVIAIIWFLPSYYTYVIFAFIIFWYALNNLSKKDGYLQNMMARFERRNVEYGTGAIHLAAGVSLMLGFANVNLAIFGMASLIFGDAIATIVGIRFYRSRRMPHNKRKSYAGSIAFFITSAIFGIITIGIYGILIAAALAVVESVDTLVDDNIAIPIAALVLGTFIR